MRKFCRTVIGEPEVLTERLQKVVDSFKLLKDIHGITLFKQPQFDKELKNQLLHIERGCISDPKEANGQFKSMAIDGGTVQLGGKNDERARVTRWYSTRGSSRLEGFHTHKNKWVTNYIVGEDLYQSQLINGTDVELQF